MPPASSAVSSDNLQRYRPVKLANPDGPNIRLHDDGVPPLNVKTTRPFVPPRFRFPDELNTKLLPTVTVKPLPLNPKVSDAKVPAVPDHPQTHEPDPYSGGRATTPKKPFGDVVLGY